VNQNRESLLAGFSLRRSDPVDARCQRIIPALREDLARQRQRGVVKSVEVLVVEVVLGRLPHLPGASSRR
jgi:hypothetical protein